jgi:hypothetical protein
LSSYCIFLLCNCSEFAGLSRCLALFYFSKDNRLIVAEDFSNYLPQQLLLP